MFHLGAISATTFADADVMIANNLNYSIALWRWCARERASVDLRLVGRDLRRRFGRVRRWWRHRRLEVAAAAESVRLVEARLRPLGIAGAAGGQAPPVWSGLKFFNVFGPNEHHKGEMTSLMVKTTPAFLPARLSAL